MKLRDPKHTKVLIVTLAETCLRQRISEEVEQITRVREQHARKVAIVPWTPEEPVGPVRLLALTRGSAGQRSPG